MTYDDQNAGLPQARWMATEIARPETQQAGLRVSDVETAMAAVAAGLGKSLLPDAATVSEPRLRRSSLPAPNPPVTRDIWQLSHRDQNHRAGVNAAKTWLGSLHWC